MKLVYSSCFQAVRSFQTSAVQRDTDSAAKFIGAGAATVGVAGSGKFAIHERLDSLLLEVAVYFYLQ